MGWFSPLLTSSLVVLSLGLDVDLIVRAPGDLPCKTVKWNTCQFPFQWEYLPTENQDDLPHHAQVPGSNILWLHQAPIHQRSCLVQNYRGALRRLPSWLPATKPGSVQVINFYPWRSGLCKEAWSSMLNSMFTRDHRGNSHQAGDKWLKDCNSCSCQQVRFFHWWG